MRGRSQNYLTTSERSAKSDQLALKDLAGDVLELNRRDCQCCNEDETAGALPLAFQLGQRCSMTPSDRANRAV